MFMMRQFKESGRKFLTLHYSTSHLLFSMSHHRRPWKAKVPMFSVALGVLLLGCGADNPQTYPVKGTGVFTDGSHLPHGGLVLTELVQEGTFPVNARGIIGDDGSFQLTTYDDGDGAVPGEHRFLVRAQRIAMEEVTKPIVPSPVIDKRFERFETSGLRYTVQETENEFKIEVEPPSGV